MIGVKIWFVGGESLFIQPVMPEGIAPFEADQRMQAESTNLLTQLKALIANNAAVIDVNAGSRLYVLRPATITHMTIMAKDDA